jgi:hypothetical protein
VKLEILKNGPGGGKVPPWIQSSWHFLSLSS